MTSTMLLLLLLLLWRWRRQLLLLWLLRRMLEHVRRWQCLHELLLLVRRMVLMIIAARNARHVIHAAGRIDIDGIRVVNALDLDLNGSVVVVGVVGAFVGAIIGHCR